MTTDIINLEEIAKEDLMEKIEQEFYDYLMWDGGEIYIGFDDKTNEIYWGTRRYGDISTQEEEIIYTLKTGKIWKELIYDWEEEFQDVPNFGWDIWFNELFVMTFRPEVEEVIDDCYNANS